MPNRLIRDGLLESEAVLSLPVEARWLYVSILLSADDVGLFDATPFRLARRADVRREMADKLVQMLADADLIRLYEVDGKRYGFIPRYGQRLQLRRHKHPVPPMALLQGDADAIKKINDLDSKSSVNNGESRMDSGDSPPEAEAEAEVIQHPSDVRAQAVASAPDCPHRQVLDLWKSILPEMPQHDPELWSGARATNLKTRWREVAKAKGWTTKEQGLAWFERLFRYVALSSFLTGHASSGDRRPFLIELEWLVKHANWVKVREGKYHQESEVAHD